MAPLLRRTAYIPHLRYRQHINSYGWPATPVRRPPAHGNPVFEVDLSGYHPRFSLKRVKSQLVRVCAQLVRR